MRIGGEIEFKTEVGSNTRYLFCQVTQTSDTQTSDWQKGCRSIKLRNINAWIRRQTA